ncbi:MAG: response regulator transcription factor [Pseudomonadota bacterium]
MEPSILIAEDDDHTSALLIRYFTNAGFETLRAANGIDALQVARSRRLSIVVLDLMMPGKPGWDVCEELRSTSDVPILILSARQEEADRILGLNLGADDYVVKPFSPREVVARVNAILRRSQRNQEPSAEVMTHGDLELDTLNRTVTLSGTIVELTTSEFTLLSTLLRHPGRAFTRSELLDHLHSGQQVVIDRVVDVHVASIRQKLESVSSSAQIITTVRGVGYRLGK